MGGNDILGFKHSGNFGDLLYAIPAIKEYYRKTGRKPILYLDIGVVGFYYAGAKHPVQNERGESVLLNEKMYNKIRPLLLEQPYIEDVRIYTKDVQEKVINLDLIRTSFVNITYSCLSRVYFYIYPDLACDLAERFIDLPKTNVNYAKNKIIVNRSERYQNESIDYSFLKAYEDRVLFAGLPHEHEIFCKQFGLNIGRLKDNNFLETAYAIDQCDFFIGNQSSNFALATMLKTPRILEICHFAPNVHIYGNNAYDFYAQMGLMYYFKELYRKARYLGELEKTDEFHNNMPIYLYQGIKCVIDADKYMARITPVNMEQDLGNGKGQSKLISIKH